MDCRRCLEALSAATDGEASAAEETAARIHLARCAACRAADARMTAVDRQLHDLIATWYPDCTDTVLSAVVSASLRDPPERPRCVPEHIVVWPVGTAGCGCVVDCCCGCQHGAPCQCYARAA